MKEFLNDFVARISVVSVKAMPESIFIHPDDLQAIGRKTIETVFHAHPEIIPPNMETIFQGNDMIFFGKRIVEHALKNKIGVDAGAFNQQKGRAKLCYSDGSNREVKI